MSVGVPALPTTFRPYIARRVIGALAVAVTLVLGAVIVTLPERGGEVVGFSTTDRLAFAVVALMALAGLWLLNRPRISADQTGIVVTNVFRSRRLDWAEIVGVTLTQDDPWLVLDLGDGTSLAAMGVQTSDGQRARLAADQLRALVAEQTATPYDN